MSLLLRFNADVNMPDYKACTPLHYAVKQPNVTLADALIGSGALVNALDYRGMTPLQHIVNSDNTEMIKLLLQRNAIVNMQDNDGRTPLFRAVEVGNEPGVQLLLQDSGTRVNLKDRNNVTPLHLAAAFKRLQLAKMLIRASADLNSRDFWNATPLHYAAYAGAPEIVSLLLEAGAGPKLTDTDGLLPAQYARSRHNYRTALKCVEEYRHDVAKNVLCHTLITPSSATDDTIQSFPADDDPFTVSVPRSRLYGEIFDSSILPRELRDSYMNAKCAKSVSAYLHRMCLVPGVGQIPTDIDEVKIIKQSATEFMFKWAEKIAVIDPRFRGTLLPCGSVFDGTKVGDPDEFDYMLELEELPRVYRVTFDSDTKYDEVTVLKRADASLEFVEGEQQLDSQEVMNKFVKAAYCALVDPSFDYNSVARHLYVEDVTEETVGQQTTIWAEPGWYCQL